MWLTFLLKGFSEKNCNSYTKWAAHPLQQPPCKKLSHYGRIKRWKKFNFFHICLNFILFFFPLALNVIVIKYVPFPIIYLIEHFATFFTFQSFPNNIKDQFKEKTYIWFGNHRNNYLCINHVKNATKNNQKTTTVTWSTYHHVFHIHM